MAKTRSLAILMVFVFLSLSMDGCRLMSKESSRQLLGGVEVRNKQLGGGLAQPGRAPRTVYVEDFKLDADNFQGDHGIRGIMPGSAQQRGVPGQLGQRLPHPFATNDPFNKARQIVDTMADALVDRFSSKGMPAQRLASTSNALPSDGWLLQGMFTEVDEGNRFKRAIIGFGKGATSMEIQVGVSDLAGKQPRQPFIIFGTVKDPSKLPGAVVTMNPYMAAAKFVMEKNATEKDIKHSADQIVDEVLKYEQKFKEEAAANVSGK